MHPKKLHAIRRFCFVIIASAGISLTACAQDTIVLKVSEFDRLANELLTEQKLSQNFRNGFDSLKAWYVDVVQKYNQSQANLVSCMRERDTAHALITRLRTDISRAWMQRDMATANYQKEHERRAKPFGFMIGGNVQPNPFRVTYGITFGWTPAFLRFSTGSGGATVAPDNTLNNQLFNR